MPKSVRAMKRARVKVWTHNTMGGWMMISSTLMSSKAASERATRYRDAGYRVEIELIETDKGANE